MCAGAVREVPQTEGGHGKGEFQADGDNGSPGLLPGPSGGGCARCGLGSQGELEERGPAALLAPTAAGLAAARSHQSHSQS